MKRITTILIFVFFIAAVTLSFFAGNYMNDKEHIEDKAQRCNRLISFAITTIENKGFSTEGALETTISNIYAAHELCDNPEISAELNDLWNDLIYHSDSYIGKEDELTAKLKNIMEDCQ